MSRNSLIFLISTILIIGFVGMGAYFYFTTGSITGNMGQKTEGGGLLGFLPFGGQSGDTGTRSEDTGNQTAGGNKDVIPNSGSSNQILLKLTQNPVAGFIPTVVGSTTAVRYMEKETGRIFEIDMSIPSAKTRITNTTIPKVYQAIFSQNGSSVLVRSLLSNASGVIETYSATIPKATSTELLKSGVELKGSFLEGVAHDLSVSPSSGRMFSLSVFGGSAIGTVSDLNGGKKAQIFDSPFTEWLSSWVNDKTILLATKPSSVATGYVYSLDSASGLMQKIYGGGYGLTAVLSPDGKNLFISEAGDSGPSSKMYSVSGHTGTDIGLKTIADKCLWAGNSVVYCAVPSNMPSVQGGYPDVWYQGLVSFADSIWRIDTETASTDVVLDVSSTAREPLDAVSLALDKNMRYLFFTDKKSGTLWSLKLTK